IVQSVMPGIVREIMVKSGDEIEQGSPLIILEAMKMENEISAPVAGKVLSIQVTEGDAVAAGAALLVIDLES
ncbi:MAG: acetyl-CoA carboxylase biotin carboxyl carrier protein subunit, partial [Planctomycetota bacterium]